jgi:ketosteroid isomerase-like protein
MKAFALASVAILLAAAAVAAPAKPTAVPKENATLAEATTVVDAFHAALKKGDRKAAMGMLDDSVEIFEQGSVERSKAEYASHHLDADIAFSAGTKMKRTSSGGAMLGNLAYFTSQNTVTRKYKDQTVDSIMIETMVLHKTPAGWRILHIHWSTRKPTPAAAKETRGAQP